MGNKVSPVGKVHSQQVLLYLSFFNDTKCCINSWSIYSKLIFMKEYSILNGTDPALQPLPINIQEALNAKRKSHDRKKEEAVNDLIRYLNGISQLDQEASDDLLKDFKTRTFNKNDFLLKPQDVCRYFYFVETGLTKSFSYNKNQEFIM